jgi:hypothetical protein
MVLRTGVAMVSDLDIWRAAGLLIRKYGADAELEAGEAHRLMLDRGDDEGQHLWARNRRAIEDLQALRRGRLNQAWRPNEGGSCRHRRVADNRSYGSLPGDCRIIGFTEPS